MDEHVFSKYFKLLIVFYRATLRKYNSVIVGHFYFTFDS